MQKEEINLKKLCVKLLIKRCKLVHNFHSYTLNVGYYDLISAFNIEKKNIALYAFKCI